MSFSVLGIHSNSETGKKNGGAKYSSVTQMPKHWSQTIKNDKAGGHAWVSLTESGATTNFGLWPDNHPLTEDNGEKSDIRVGLESIKDANVSRYYKLSSDQVKVLKQAIKRNETWRLTHNCSSWASDIVKTVLDEDVNADDWGLLGVETPRQLGASISRMEQKDPTSRLHPKDLTQDKKSFWIW